MAPESKALQGVMVIVAALVATLAMGFRNPALAAPGSLREAFANAVRGDGARSSATPIVARYIIDEGGGFVLDRREKKPLLKFDDSSEIWVLQPMAAPRGDTIYKNDAGEQMLRATKLGGMTVFTQRRLTGSAAAMAGVAQPLHLSPLGAVGLYQRFFQASVRASRSAQHLIGFETADDAESSTVALFADSAAVAVEAVVSIASRPDGKPLLARIGKVVFLTGAKPQAALQNGVLLITVAPSQGIAGRPSSRRIQRAVGVK
jgi:hypothetical protein